MKRLFLLLMMVSVLFLSCNKNRFDYTYLDSVESQGSWCLPIASVHTTLGDVLDQLEDNDMVAYQPDGTIMINYSYALEDVLKGSDIMKYDNFDYEYQTSVDNPYPITVPALIDTTIKFDQTLVLNSETAHLHRATIRSGVFSFLLQSNVGLAESIVISSSNIKNADGTDFSINLTLGEQKTIDLSGLRLETAVENTLNFSYDAHLVLTGFAEPTFDFAAEIHVTDIEIEELSGWVNAFTIPFGFDTTFTLPLANLEGDLALVNSHLIIQADNTFAMGARVQIDTARLYGDGLSTNLFTHYPVYADVQALSQSVALDETLALNLNTNLNAVQTSGSVILNPNGLDEMVTILNTSTIGLTIDGRIPVSFSSNNVCYMDTLDIDLGEIESPEMISLVELFLDFESGLPFNMMAQLYAYDSSTGQITETIFDDPFSVAGSFDGTPTTSHVDLRITQEKFQSVVNADQLIMRYSLNTDNKEVSLNLDDDLSVEIKLKVNYDGEIISLENN